MGGGGEEKFVSGSGWPTQTQPVELHDPFEVGEQHLDLLAFVAGSLVRRRIFEPSDDIARGFVHASRHLAHGLARIPGIRVPSEEVQTNIVMFESSSAGSGPELDWAEMDLEEIGS